MVKAIMHGGPHNGETIEMPWARIEVGFLRFESPVLDGMLWDVYRLRGPWRGQEIAHYDYVEPDKPSKKSKSIRHKFARWLWIKWGCK